MRYDVRMKISYIYFGSASSGRHLLRMAPVTVPGEQTVISSTLSVDPVPEEWQGRVDFFQNPVVEVAYRKAVRNTVFRLDARVERHVLPPAFDISPVPGDLGQEVAAWRGLDPLSPHHFLAPTARVPIRPEMTAYGREMTAGARSTWDAVRMLGEAIHRDWTYDPDATTVDTPAEEAFACRHGVCQDFTHIMTACLRGLGIPAGYVSGFLRTRPPPGKPRLEGADAMHAWVRAWCGFEMGWVEYDPTNAMAVGLDHVVIARGRDYSDVAPITGVMWTAGGQSTDQAVDMIPLD